MKNRKLLALPIAIGSFLFPALSATTYADNRPPTYPDSVWEQLQAIRQALQDGQEVDPLDPLNPDPVVTPPATGDGDDGGSQSGNGGTSGGNSDGSDGGSGEVVDPGDPDLANPDYDEADSQSLTRIVYTRVPRTQGTHLVTLKDGTSYTLHSPDSWDRLPDTRHIYDGFNAPGQLVYRDAEGNERILYDCMNRPTPCVPLDPAVSLDGKKILFSVYSAASLEAGWWMGTTLPNRWLGKSTGARLHVVDVESGAVTPLAHTAGTRDISPTWLPDGRIMFSSDRQFLREPFLDRISPDNRPNPRLYIANSDGTNAKLVTPHEVSAAMHPYLLRSGRIAYGSSWLSHNLPYQDTNGGINWPGTLDNMWVVMDMDVRGGDMTALLGGHRDYTRDSANWPKTMKALHFLGQRNNGDICVSNYYRGNNLGLGDVICWPPEPKGVEGNESRFIPRKLYHIANWSESNDQGSRTSGGIYMGKVGYPERAPNNQLYLTVGRGHCSQSTGTVISRQEFVADQPEQRACDVGLYLTTRIPSQTMGDLERVVDLPEWHEFGARTVSDRTIYNSTLSNTRDGSCELTSSDAGTAETEPYKAYEFNNMFKVSANNGGEIQDLPHTELAGIRFWQIIPNTSEKADFINITGNRLRLLGDAPLLADKSFKVSLPCDTPYIMAGIDNEGRVIKRDQIPQSLRPGEKRVCGGCHLHSRLGRPYENSLAFSSTAHKLLNAVPVPEYERDIRPILQNRCISCHDSSSSMPLPLLDYDMLVWDQFQEAVPASKRLQVSDSDDEKRRWGLHRPYTSRYVNSMFARESLLYWKAANERTDGRTDSTYDNDIDFGPNHPTSITTAELKMIADWIDSGATLSASP
ncbi:MAG: hypothetical protein ACK5ME_00145 [Parahaliea sp.]